MLEEVRCSPETQGHVYAAFAALAQALRKLPARMVTASEAADLVNSLRLGAEVR